MKNRHSAYLVPKKPSSKKRTFIICDKILITCRELYFEVDGHVYLIKMGNFPENEVFTVKDYVQNDTCLL